MRHSVPTKAGLLLLAAMVLGLALTACGGGETTVTVTKTVAAKPGNSGGSKKSNSGELPPKAGPVTGYVDFAKAESGSLILDGWAAASDLSHPASRVVAQVDGKTLAEAVPTVKREDVVKALGKPGLLESGFELRLPLDSLKCGSPAAGVKVVGSLGGKSSTLSFAEGIKEAITKAC
jgi:hypothetical protein